MLRIVESRVRFPDGFVLVLLSRILRIILRGRGCVSDLPPDMLKPAANQAFGNKSSFWANKKSKKNSKSYFRKTVFIFGNKKIHKKEVGGKSLFAGNAGFSISGSKSLTHPLKGAKIPQFHSKYFKFRMYQGLERSFCFWACMVVVAGNWLCTHRRCCSAVWFDDLPSISSPITKSDLEAFNSILFWMWMGCKMSMILRCMQSGTIHNELDIPLSTKGRLLPPLSIFSCTTRTRVFNSEYFGSMLDFDTKDKCLSRAWKAKVSYKNGTLHNILEELGSVKAHPSAEY